MTQYELYHHGILGQKWGRRQGPPYPLDPSDHSAAERKAGYRKSIEGGGRYLKNKTRKTATAASNAAKEAYERHNSGHHRSLKGNLHRELAGVHELNEKIYNKMGYKTMASINKSAKNQQLKKAEAADRKAILKKQEKIESKFQKKLDKNARQDAKINKARDKARSKIIKKSKDPRSLNDKLKDFDEGTRLVKAGQDRYRNNIERYKNAKISVLENKAYKNDPEYKKAVKAYTDQRLTDTFSNGGSTYTKLAYALDEGKKKKRG